MGLVDGKFEQLYNSIPTAIFTVDVNRVITSVNKKALALFGYGSEDMVGRSCSEFCLGLCTEKCRLFDDRIPKPVEFCEGVIRRADDSLLIVAKSLNLLKNEWGEIIGGIETLEDITERKRTEEALKETEERYRTLYDSTSSPVLVTDLKGNYIDCNEAACRYFECSREELTSMNVTDILPDKKGKEPTELKKRLKREGIVEAEFVIKGRTKVLELTITPSVWQGKKIIVGVGKDITERKQAEARIIHMAYHDTLTGFPNRALFQEKLISAIRVANIKNRKLAVLFLDLDRFKTVNDTLGHDCGDRLLMIVADRIRNCVRKGDLVARLSGDEFIILLTGIDKVLEATKVSQKIIDSIKRPVPLSQRELHVTASIGIAIFPEDGNNYICLMQNADTAMYRAKEQGGNICCTYNPSMNEKASARLEMENSLRVALENDELRLFYQPQVDSESGEIVGMEALLRWEHPTLGLVPPMDFIPLAEETGLILPIGEWVIETACRQNKEWQDKGCTPVRVAVNISAKQFQQKGFVAKVSRILRNSGLPARFLELEITESTAMQDLSHTIHLVKKLKKLGVNISIDDFGIGYASLSYLKLFPPIDTLKIDRSFVKDIPKGEENASSALIATMIVLAKNLRLKVVAEGVEKIEQLEFLREKRCDQIQGYFFSKPVPPAQFEKLLQKQPFKGNGEVTAVAAGRE